MHSSWYNNTPAASEGFDPCFITRLPFFFFQLEMNACTCSPPSVLLLPIVKSFTTVIPWDSITSWINAAALVLAILSIDGAHSRSLPLRYCAVKVDETNRTINTQRTLHLQCACGHDCELRWSDETGSVLWRADGVKDTAKIIVLGDARFRASDERRRKVVFSVAEPYTETMVHKTERMPYTAAVVLRRIGKKPD
jgi:hypothetical protein